MKRLTLALRLLGRDLRSGEVRVLALAVVIAVASVTSVGFFTDRIQQLLEQQANVLMGADLVISADHVLDADFSLAARQRGLRTAQTVSFLSMVQADGHNQLTAVKAVSAAYPLRGELRIAPQRFVPDHVAQTIPARGTVWADERLLGELKIAVGDRITVGDAVLRLAAVISHEPDRGGSLFSIAPRLLMNRGDVAATGLIQPGSRVHYRLLVAGDAATLKNYRKVIVPKLARGERLETVEDARPEMRTALERARQFLGLASMVSVMLAGVAMAMAARRFVARHLDNVAILRTFGATQRDIAALYGWQLLVLGLAASALGCVTGYIAQGLLGDILGSLAASTLPAPSWFPVLIGMLVGLITLAAFTVPPLMHLRRVPTLRVLRRDMGALPGPSRAAYLVGVAALAMITVWQADNLRLGLMVLGGSAATIIVLALTAAAVMTLLKRLGRRASGVWRFGIANLTRRSQGSVVQVVAFGVGMLALLLLGVVRVDLLADWQASLPPQAPNRFVINIQPEQVKALTAFFKANNFTGTDLFPMVRGRLTAINAKPVSPDNYQDQRAKRLVEREFNLSWAKTLQSDNSIVAGRWWTNTDAAQPLLSVEEGIAKTLGIAVGDTLSYQIGGEMFSARVTNLRKVAWDSFHVNFFVIASPGSLAGFPTSYITSFYLPVGKEAFLGRMVQRFPNLTVIDVAAIMSQVRQVIERVTLALEYVFAFTVLAGLMVLYAAIQSSLDERLLEGAVLRTLGAGRRQLLGGMAVEFAGIGLIAGLIAASGAAAADYILAEHLFHFSYHLNVALWWWGGGGGALSVAVAGLWGTRFILRRPPWQTLRELQGA
jgi:putative ABC transport system permease protein